MSYQLTRDELEDRLDRLETTLDDVQATLADRGLEHAKDRQRISALEAENERLREELAALRSSVNPDPTGKAYDEMDRTDRVFKLRMALVRKAEQGSGKAAMDYNAVLSLFDNRMAAGTAYKDMKAAADWDAETQTSHKDGFTYDPHGGENKRILVNLDAVKDEAVFHAVNNRTGVTPDE